MAFVNVMLNMVYKWFLVYNFCFDLA